MELCAEQGEREIAMRNVPKHLRNNSATIERLAICAHSGTNARTTGDIRPSPWRKYLFGAAFELVEAGGHRRTVAADAFEKNFCFAITAGIGHADNLSIFTLRRQAALLLRPRGPDGYRLGQCVTGLLAGRWAEDDIRGTIRALI